MSDHPELYYWIYLLPIALLAFWMIRYSEGELKPTALLSHSLASAVCYFVLWKMGLFRLLIYPLLLTALGFFLWTLARAKARSKAVAALLLGLFLTTGLYAHFERKKHGAYWELYNKQDAGASFGWLANAAKDKRFTREQLLFYLKSEDDLVKKNAKQIAILQAQEESGLDEADEFYRALMLIDPATASSYLLKLPYEIQDEVKAKEDANVKAKR